jgi:hypothetical protein
MTAEQQRFEPACQSRRLGDRAAGGIINGVLDITDNCRRVLYLLLIRK